MAKRETAEHRIEEFAEDLGKLLGVARNKAEGWLGQRQTIVKQLTELRDTASTLLTDLGHEARRAVRGDSSPRSTTPSAPAPKSKKQRRKLSAKARKAISDAQKRRWAAQRAAAK